MASALSALALPEQPDPVTSGNVIAECLPFADGFTWGPVAMADVSIGGEKASAVPINILDDNSSFSPVPTTCGTNGMPLSSVNALGANGVLGLGSFAQDCGPGCNIWYYTCTTMSSCTPTNEPLNSQVTNPVALFVTDNNGVIVQLPAIADTGQTTATGFLVFGIGTQSNNGLGTATVLTADPANATITTSFNSQMLSGFLDSGSNGLFFADSSIPNCPGSAAAMQFYCPASTVPLMATNQGQNGNTSPVSFTIANLQKLSQSDFALDDVGGTATPIAGLGAYFDFGLPFFYGRTVFTAIEKMPADGTTGPYFAY